MRDKLLPKRSPDKYQRFLIISGIYRVNYSARNSLINSNVFCSILLVLKFTTYFQNLLSTTGFGMACSYIARWEEQGSGVQWSNYYQSPMPGDDYSLGTCINMMLLDAVLYFIILWYVENVMPGKIIVLIFIFFIFFIL